MPIAEPVRPLRYTYVASSDSASPNPDDIKTVTKHLTDFANNAQTQVLSMARSLSDLTAYLCGWLEKRARGVDRAYLTHHEGDFLFLVVRNQVRVDFAVTDELTDLAIAIQEAFPGIPFRTLALPKCSDEAISSFVDASFAFLFVKGNPSADG